MSLNVIFSSVGRRVELIRSFRAAFETLGLSGSIIGTDIDPLAPAARVVDRLHLVPVTTDPEFVDSLLDICADSEASMLFPLIDPDVPPLSDAAHRFTEIGCKVAVPSPKSVLIATDKWHTYEFFTGLGLPTPRTWLAQHLADESLEFPVFVKPRVGSAGQGSHKVGTREELDFYRSQTEDLLVQEFLGGPEVTTDVVMDLNGNFLGAVNRQRIEVRSGEVAKGVTVRFPDVLEGAREIATALGIRGPATVQCMFAGNQPFFTEVNLRFAGGVPLAIAAGANFPLWLLAAECGAIEAPTSEYEVGLHMTRFDDSFFVRSSDLLGK